MTYLLFFSCRLYLKKNMCICLLFGKTSLTCNKWKFNMKNEIESMKSQGPHGLCSRLLPLLKRNIRFKSVFGCPPPAPPTKVGDIRNSGEMEIKHYTVSKLSSDSSKGKSREKRSAAFSASSRAT